MRKSGFTEEQITAVLSTAEVCRRHGGSQTTFYKWKDRVPGFGVGGGGPTRCPRRAAWVSRRGWAGEVG